MKYFMIMTGTHLTKMGIPELQKVIRLTAMTNANYKQYLKVTTLHQFMTTMLWFMGIFWNLRLKKD